MKKEGIEGNFLTMWCSGRLCCWHSSCNRCVVRTPGLERVNTIVFMVLTDSPIYTRYTHRLSFCWINIFSILEEVGPITNNTFVLCYCTFTYLINTIFYWHQNLKTSLFNFWERFNPSFGLPIGLSACVQCLPGLASPPPPPPTPTLLWLIIYRYSLCMDYNTIQIPSIRWYL